MVMWSAAGFNEIERTGLSYSKSMWGREERECALSCWLVCLAASKWGSKERARPFMLPGEVTVAEWHLSFSLDEIYQFETPTAKKIPALNNDLKFFLLHNNPFWIILVSTNYFQDKKICMISKLHGFKYFCLALIILFYNNYLFVHVTWFQAFLSNTNNS